MLTTIYALGMLVACVGAISVHNGGVRPGGFRSFDQAFATSALPALGVARAACGLRAPPAPALGRKVFVAPSCTAQETQPLPRMPPTGFDQAEERRDYIEYRDAKISFLRGAFGQVDDIKGEVVRTVPYFADQPLSNGEELRGRIAMVLRGSDEGRKCSFVDKANRVADAGAVGMIVVNNENTLISPGDSAREGDDIELPVVGIRRSDADMLPDGAHVFVHFHPMVPLTSEQRKHLRATAIIRDNAGVLSTTVLDDKVPSEEILGRMDLVLSAHELVRASFGDESNAGPLSILDIEDVIDVASVMADNLGAVVVLISQSWFVMYRASEITADPIILPAEGQLSSLDMDLEEGMRGAVSIVFDSGGEEIFGAGDGAFESTFE